MAETLSRTKVVTSPSSPATGAWRRRLAAVRRRVPRAVWLALLVVVGLYVVAMVGANVILRTGLLRSWLNASPDELYVDYRSAWSPWPGRVIARDLTLRFQDDNVQMLVDLERVSMTVDLADLGRRTFHVRSLDGAGVSFRMRHKLASAEGQEARLEAYPPIVGFPDPPVRKPKPKRQIPDDDYRLWTVELEDVAASVREIWIMEYRYRGEGSIAGGMRLKPLRELWIPPSVLLTRGGVLSIGSHEILTGSQARVEAQVDAYDVRVPVGTAVLRQLTARAEMQGDTSTIAPFASTYLRRAGVAFAGGAGHLNVSARIDHGLVHPDSRIEWHTKDVTVRLPGDVTVRSDLGFVGHVDAGKGGAAAALLDPDARPSLVAELAASHTRASSGKDALADLDDVRAVVATANDDLTAPFPISSATLDVASAHVPDLRTVGALVAPPGIDVRKGALTAAIRARMRGETVDARADIVLDDLYVVTEPLDVACAKGKLVAVVASKDVSAGVSVGGSSVALDGVAVRVKDSRTDGLAITVDVADGLVRTKRGTIDGSVTTRIVPGDRVLRLAASLASLPKALAEAPAGPDARATMRVHAGNDGVDVRVLEAHDGDLVGRGRMRKPKQGPANGAFLLEVGPLRAGVEIAGGETHVRPFASDDWLRERTR